MYRVNTRGDLFINDNTTVRPHSDNKKKEIKGRQLRPLYL